MGLSESCLKCNICEKGGYCFHCKQYASEVEETDFNPLYRLCVKCRIGFVVRKTDEKSLYQMIFPNILFEKNIIGS